MHGGEGAGEAARDQGLSRRVGALGLGVAIFNTVVGAGIFILPAALARDAGAAAPLALLVCAVATGGVVICFAAAGSRVPSSGGPYAVADAAFGPLVGFLIGVLLWLSCVLAAAGIAAAIADTLAPLLAPHQTAAARATLIVLLFLLLGTANIAGVSPGTRTVGAITVAKIIPILVLLTVGALHVKAANLTSAFHGPSPSFGRGLVLAIFAFQGMEGALAMSGEVRQPARNVPLGLLGAMAIIGVLYIAIQIVTQGVLGPALAQSKAPLADAVAGVSPALYGLLLAGATVSMLGYLAGDGLSAPRVLFAFGRDGYLPMLISRLGSRTRAPYMAIIAHLGIACVLALSGGFEQLAILSSLSTVVVYLVCCVGAVLLQRRGVALAGAPLKVSGLTIAAAIGIAGMAWIAAQAKPAELLGCAITLVLAAAIYFATGPSRRRRAQAGI